MHIRTVVGAGSILLISLLSFTVHAAESEAEKVIAQIEATFNDVTDPSRLKSLVADAISERLDFLDVSYVEPDSSGGSSGWNAKYDLAYGSSGGEGFGIYNGRAGVNSFAFNLDIEGSYSFNDAVNPEDLSKVNLALSYLRGDFGALAVDSPPNTDAYTDCLGTTGETPDREEYDSDEAFRADYDPFMARQRQCWVDHEIDRLVRQEHAPFVYSVDFHAKLEGDQKFSDTNTVYGAEVMFSKTRLPSVRLLYENVDASENEKRMAVTPDAEFDRVSAEIGYSHTFRNLAEVPVSFYLDYRYFHELSAPAAIKTADMENFDYFAAMLRIPAHAFGFIESEDFNLFLRYTDGQLPFDLVEDQAIQIGFSTNIGFLANLLPQ